MNLQFGDTSDTLVLERTLGSQWPDREDTVSPLSTDIEDTQNQHTPYQVQSKWTASIFRFPCLQQGVEMNISLTSPADFRRFLRSQHGMSPERAALAALVLTRQGQLARSAPPGGNLMSRRRLERGGIRLTRISSIACLPGEFLFADGRRIQQTGHATKEAAMH